MDTQPRPTARPPAALLAVGAGLLALVILAPVLLSFPVDLLAAEGTAELVGDAPVEQVLRALARVELVDAVAGAEEPAVMVHPVVADANRTLLRAAEDGDRTVVQRTAIALVRAALAPIDWSDPDGWPRVRQLTPHLHALLESVAPQLSDEDLATLIDAAGALDWSGGTTAAMRLLTDALACASARNPERRVVLRARALMAIAIGRVGRWDEAERLLHEILHVQRRVLGKDHPDTLRTRHRIGRAAAGMRRWAEAEAAFRDLLVAYRRVQGDDHRDTLAARHELARAIGQQGRWAEAEVSLRDLLEVERRVLGEDHPNALVTRNDLAWTIAEQGRWTEAEPIFRAVLDAMRRVLGPDHPDTLITQSWLDRPPAQTPQPPESPPAAPDPPPRP